MYPERFRPGFIAGVLMAAAERKRPALGAWGPRTREQLEAVFREALAPIRVAFFEVFDDRAYWDGLEAMLFREVFPRYAAVSEWQTHLEQGEFGIWRGGDLVARAAYALGGLVFGIACVEIRYIPIEWDGFAFLTMLAAPFIPDLQIGWKKRRHRKALERIMVEADAAEATQELYAPLGLKDDAASPSPVSSEPTSDVQVPSNTNTKLKE